MTKQQPAWQGNDLDMFLLTVEQSLSAVAIADTQGVIVYANPRFAELTGYPVQQAIGMSVNDVAVIGEEDLATIWEALGKGEAWSGEMKAGRRGSRAEWILNHVSPIHNEKGQVTHYVSITLDITESKKAEQALRRSEENFRAVLESSPVAMFLVQDGQTIFANSTAASSLGYTVEELIQADFDTLVHPDDREVLLSGAAAMMTGSPVTGRYETRFITKDSELRWGDLSASVFQYEGRPAIIAAAVDITERKAAEQALRESEARYRFLFQDNPAMYFTVAEDGIVLSVNDFGASQLGYGAEELIGRQVLDVFHPEDQPRVEEQLADVLARPGETANWEFRKVRKDGRIIWVREVARATQDAQGRPVVLVVCEDITEHKRVEAENQALREELERKAQRAVDRGNPYGMSFRELTVLQLVISGMSDKEIGATLDISPLTANKHVANILKKMKAASRTEAGVRAIRERLIR